MDIPQFQCRDQRWEHTGHADRLHVLACTLLMQPLVERTVVCVDVVRVLLQSESPPCGRIVGVGDAIPVLLAKLGATPVGELLRWLSKGADGDTKGENGPIDGVPA